VVIWVTGVWRKYNDLYCSTNIVRVIKSRRIRRAGHVARIGEKTGIYRCWWGILRERDHLGDPAVDGSIILRWMFKNFNVDRAASGSG
jgi:hypothetical protein